MAGNPGDAANAFVRVILTDAGRLAGGLSASEWKCTLEYFDHRCAYTGVSSTKEKLQKEHAIPINREHCGLHLYGNVVPATKAANDSKHNKHYKDFLKDDLARLRKLDTFMEKAGYHERVKPFEQHIQRFCQAQYERITALCAENKKHLGELVPEGSATYTVHEVVRGDRADGARRVIAKGLETRQKRTGSIHEEIVSLLMVEVDGVGLSYRKIADTVRERVPGASTTPRSVACYKQYARKRTRGITEAQALKILSIKTRV